MTHITKEGLLQALSELSPNVVTTRSILARAAELSAQESKPVDRFRAVLAEARRIEPFGQGGESNDYINGWKDVLEFIARAYEDKNYKLAAPPVSAQDASPKDGDPPVWAWRRAAWELFTPHWYQDAADTMESRARELAKQGPPHD